MKVLGPAIVVLLLALIAFGTSPFTKSITPISLVPHDYLHTEPRRAPEPTGVARMQEEKFLNRVGTFIDLSTLRVTSLFGKTGSLTDLAITETIDEVIIYHSDGLHMGINDSRTNETESATLEVLAECIGFG